MGGWGGKQDRLAKTSYSGKWAEAVSLDLWEHRFEESLTQLVSVRPLAYGHSLPPESGGILGLRGRVYHPCFPGPFTSLLLLPGHGPKHWGSDHPGASVGLVLPQGQEWGTRHPRDRHFPATVCPMGFSCSPGWVLGPSELEAGFKPPFLHSSSHSSSCLPRWQASSSFYLHPHLRKTRSRHVCTLGPGLPLSVPAASQHLGRGCGPDWTPGPPPCSILAAHSWAGTGKSIPYEQPPSTTPSGIRLGPQVPQHPSVGGSLLWKFPEPQAKPHLLLLVSGHLNLGLDHTPSSPCPHPFLYSPGAP